METNGANQVRINNKPNKKHVPDIFLTFLSTNLAVGLSSVCVCVCVFIRVCGTETDTFLKRCTL